MKGPSYFTAILGVTLVLIVLGLAGMIGWEVTRLGETLREQLALEVVLNDSITETPPAILESALAERSEIKSYRFVSKTEAAAILKEDIGEDFMDIIGFNPLYASYLVYLKSEHSDAASVNKLKQALSGIESVAEVSVQMSLVDLLDQKIKTAGWILGAIGLILLVFAMSIIFVTTRLALSANRFLIKSMQLFGATRWFIMKPFLGKALWNGFISGLLAALVLGGLYYYALTQLEPLGLKADFISFAALCAGLLCFGILLVTGSTLLAINRYLNKRLEDLY